MHPRADKLPTPDPDFRRFLSVLRRQPVDRVPLVELGIHPEVVDEILGDRPAPHDSAERRIRSDVERGIRVYHRLGYDMLKTAAIIPWNLQRVYASGSGDDSRAWANEHEGPIGDMDDLEAFAWPQPEDVDFLPVDVATESLPDGMGLIGFSGGILEFSMDLIGMQRFMIATKEDPELVRATVDRVGQTIYRVFDDYCGRDAIRALWLGDDLGHKTGLLVSPRLLEDLVFPWYRRYAELAHAHDRPFLLHSCGNTHVVMQTLIEDVGIDAKHSFEDVIEPVERFIDRWGDRIAILGGVDVHLLSTGDEAAIRDRMFAILDYARQRCSYAAGSGNSIPNYVPVPHFLAMVEAVHDFNRQRFG